MVTQWIESSNPCRFSIRYRSRSQLVNNWQLSPTNQGTSFTFRKGRHINQQLAANAFKRFTDAFQPGPARINDSELLNSLRREAKLRETLKGLFHVVGNRCPNFVTVDSLNGVADPACLIVRQ